MAFLLPQELDASHVTTSHNRQNADRNRCEKPYPGAIGKECLQIPRGGGNLDSTPPENGVVHNLDEAVRRRWMNLSGIAGITAPIAGIGGTYASHGCIRMFNSDVKNVRCLLGAR